MPTSSGEIQLHGCLVEVWSLGVLLLGPSGVGKSECVIELVRRGHRMVADDIVRIRRSPSSQAPAAEGDAEGLIGRAPESIRHFIEVRGLGLLSVSDLFGAEAVLDECAIDFVCRLESRVPGRSYERIGLERPMEPLLGLLRPTVTLPVQAAGNSATLVELAAQDWRLRQAGINAAQRLDERLRGPDGMMGPERSETAAKDGQEEQSG